jgi:hypothetical protein
MATTVSNVQAGIAYRQTEQRIRVELDALKTLLTQHEATAKAEGWQWGHVGDLTDILTHLRRITTPEA